MASEDQRRNPPRDNAAIENLRRFYAEHADQVRQNETLRATALSIIGVAAGAMAAIAATDGIHREDLPVAIIVTALGVVGFFQSLSQ